MYHDGKISNHNHKRVLIWLLSVRHSKTDVKTHKVSHLNSVVNLSNTEKTNIYEELLIAVQGETNSPFSENKTKKQYALRMAPRRGPRHAKATNVIIRRETVFFTNKEHACIVHFPKKKHGVCNCP